MIEDRNSTGNALSTGTCVACPINSYPSKDGYTCLTCPDQSNTFAIESGGVYSCQCVTGGGLDAILVRINYHLKQLA